MAAQLSYWERNPPFAVVAAASYTSVGLELKAEARGSKDKGPLLTFASGDVLEGTALILRYIARASSQALYGQDALGSTQIDFWLDYAATVVSGLSFESQVEHINSFLALRTFLVGYELSIADVALWGQLQGTPLWKKARTSLPHLARWFDFLAALPAFSATVDQLDWKKRAAEAKAADPSTSALGGGDTGSFDIGLPNAIPGKVVTRFPPEPSGYLHIGHAKAALLNQHFANIYNGKLLVRFDDTNPTKEKDEFVESIIKDMKSLGLVFDTITHTSDYFPQMLDLAERLIRAGVLYADDTPMEQMRQERMDSVESKCRTRSVEENLKIWEEMKLGSQIGVDNCLRFKLDMKSLNGAMRDPVAYRCNLTPHWRTGTKYKVYPMYDAACPFVDALEGVTHALRTTEYKDREAQYYWILEAERAVWPGLATVHMWDYSRLNFVHTVLSKRKLLWFVETGRVDGWDDPRMPTVQGILRRGMQVAALKEFVIGQGASKNVTFQEWDKIWSINKRIIDPVAPRHTAVVSADRVAVHLTNGPTTPELVTAPRHKKYPPAGVKVVTRSSDIWLDQSDAQLLAEGEEVTLMDWGNCIIRNIVKAPGATDGQEVVASIEAELHLEGSVKATKWKLTWLTQSDELIDLMLVDFDHLINKKKVEEDDDFEQLVNAVTRFDVPALGDSNMRILQRGDIIQLERKGYYKVDVPLIKAGKPMVLFSIPDGHTKNMAKVAQ